MKYISLTEEIAKRIWNAFDKHSNYCNEKYNKITGNKQKYGLTDRERFVNRFFKKYKNSYIILADKYAIGYKKELYVNNKSTDMIYYTTDPMSIYDIRYEEHYDAKPIINVRRQYLHIVSFRAENIDYNNSRIIMTCRNLTGDTIQYKIGLSALVNMQWVNISKTYFNSVVDIFSDDRDLEYYIGKRILSFDEMKEKKLCRKNCAVDKIPLIKEDTEPVLAKDRDEAIKQLSEKYGMYFDYNSIRKKYE